MATIPHAPSHLLVAPSANFPRSPAPAPDRVQTVQRLLMIVALYAVAVIVCLRPGFDWDLWWHLRTGQWVVDNGAVPQHDPFSAYGQDKPWLQNLVPPTFLSAQAGKNAGGTGFPNLVPPTFLSAQAGKNAGGTGFETTSKPWVAYSWLFEVLLYGLQRAFGLAGPMIFQTVLALAVVAAVHRLIARREPRFLAATALTAAAVLALAALFKQRPWMFTILFATLTLDVVLDLRAGRKNRLTWWLPVLFVLWANMHIQFIYGLFILGLACVAPLVDRVIARMGQNTTDAANAPGMNSLWLLTIICTLATLINPYHVRLYFVVVEYATQPGPFRFVNELKALEFREISDWVMLALAAAATFGLGRRRQFSSFDILLLAAAAFFAFRARRDLWFLVIASLAILTAARKRPVESGEQFAFTWPRMAYVLVALVLLVPAVWRLRGLSAASLEQSVADVFPVEAAKVVRERGYPGPLFNDFDWGGYLIWSLPEHPVIVDGRTNLHGDERLTRLGAAWAGVPGWQDDPDLAAAGVILANAATPLATLLETDPRFERVYADDMAKVFVARPK